MTQSSEEEHSTDLLKMKIIEVYFKKLLCLCVIPVFFCLSGSAKPQERAEQKFNININIALIIGFLAYTTELYSADKQLKRLKNIDSSLNIDWANLYVSNLVARIESHQQRDRNDKTQGIHRKSELKNILSNAEIEILLEFQNHPDNPYVVYVLGQIYLLQNKIQKAEDAITYIRLLSTRHFGKLVLAPNHLKLAESLDNDLEAKLIR